jgi:hypothetical protein
MQTSCVDFSHKSDNKCVKYKQNRISALKWSTTFTGPISNETDSCPNGTACRSSALDCIQVECNTCTKLGKNFSSTPLSIKIWLRTDFQENHQRSSELSKDTLHRISPKSRTNTERTGKQFINSPQQYATCWVDFHATCAWWINVKVKCAVVQAFRPCTGRTALRGRSIALLFLDQQH